MKRVCLFLLPAMLFVFCGFAAAQSCPVTYTIVNSWPGGFQAGISIKNTGTTPINGWTLEWAFSGNQQITNLWGGNVSAQGETVTVTSLSWDSSIPVGATMNSVGFTGNSTGTNTVPTAFVLNGVVCGSGGGGGNPPPVPTGLTAAAGNGVVTLSWAASAGAISYNVGRSTTSGGPYTTVGTPTATTFTDATVTNGTTYFYVVNAANTAGDSANSAQVSAMPSGSIPNVTVTINPANTQTISPWIYGINVMSAPNVPKVTLTRLGGNRWTAYNWTTNASNAGSDFNFQSDNFLSSSSIPGEAVRPTIAADIAAGQATVMTVQLQGLVSGDENGPVSTANPPDLTRFKTLVDKKSTVSSAPFTTSPLTTGPVFMDEFAWAMDQKFPGVGIFGGSTATPTFVNLDNEPELWNTTHLEVQGSTRITSDNYIAKTLTLTKALKDQFPNMVIFGPVHYGFLGVYNWQTELSATPTGTNWFTDKYLQALSGASATYGRPLVDVYDFHWYPEDYDSNSLRVTSMTSSTLTDAQMQLVVQAPRNLWDPTFADPGNSNRWVNSVLGNSPIQFLPRLKAKIASEFPSMKLSISEYEAGAFNNIAGTVGQADELGVFATEGVFAAMFWPPGGTFDYALAGFRAYRDFDGANSNFGDILMQSTSSNVQNVTVYASKDSTNPNRVVLVAINRSSASQIVAINGAPLSGTAHMYQITAATAQGQTPVKPVALGQTPVSGSSLTVTLPAYSVTTIDVH
ncbi:MAG TPA: glycoside hydrolase family 44 protein [Candidatus Angelobacter sp.]|nr:glycoside hydrolase family 44 protein [Candidatus Angelobacter sp.]